MTPEIAKAAAGLVFQFPKYTEITDLAFAVKPSYREDKYTRFFICSDVTDYWFVRLIPGFDDEYNENPNKVLIERAKIAKRNRREELNIHRLISIIENDDGDNWDCHDYGSVEDAIEDLGDIWGVNNLK